MSKKFNIHDWQAKQRLAEQDDYQRRQDALTPGKNPDAFYGPGSFYQKMKQKGVTNIPSDEEVESMSNVDIGVLDKMVKKYSMDKIMKTINILKDRPLPEGMNELNPPSETSLSRDSEIDEHHAGDYKPGFLKQTVNTFLDKLKKKTKEGKDYKTVEKIMEKYFSAKKKNEASTTGTGAFIKVGKGAAYATPKAFGDNKRKKKKGYMGYKEI